MSPGIDPVTLHVSKSWSVPSYPCHQEQVSSWETRMCMGCCRCSRAEGHIALGDVATAIGWDVIPAPLPSALGSCACQTMLCCITKAHYHLTMKVQVEGCKGEGCCQAWLPKHSRMMDPRGWSAGMFPSDLHHDCWVQENATGSMVAANDDQNILVGLAPRVCPLWCSLRV